MNDYFKFLLNVAQKAIVLKWSGKRSAVIITGPFVNRLLNGMLFRARIPIPMVVDVIFIALLVYGFYLGFSKKIIRTITLSLTVIFALLLSLNIVPFSTELLGSVLKTDSSILFFIALLASFILAVFLIRIIVSWLEGVFKKENVSMATQLTSGLIMGAILLCIYGSGLKFFENADAIGPDTKKASVTYKFTEQFPEKAMASMVSIQPMVEKFWDYVSGSVEKNYKESEKKSKRK